MSLDVFASTDALAARLLAHRLARVATPAKSACRGSRPRGLADPGARVVARHQGRAQDGQRDPLDAGFSLIEVMVALLLLLIVATGVAGLFGVALASTHAARNQTSAATLAEQKMEQLRALTWGFDDSGQNLPVTDTSTNLSTAAPTDTGQGLNPSPADSLDVNTAGYVDYLDKRGQWVGTGTTIPAAAVFVRRWNIQPLPTNPNNTIVMQVLVTTATRERGLVNPVSPRPRYPDDALIATVKTRKAD